jgi:hypothetical protein
MGVEGARVLAGFYVVTGEVRIIFMKRGMAYGN